VARTARGAETSIKPPVPGASGLFGPAIAAADRQSFATFRRVACIGGMRTVLGVCLKVLLVVVIAMVLVHFVPFLAVPMVIALVLALGLGALALIGLVVGGIAVAAVAAALLAMAVGLLAALSPAWIPLIVILGIVWLVKKLGSAHGRPTASA
jgi:hypothetical protein